MSASTSAAAPTQSDPDSLSILDLTKNAFPSSLPSLNDIRIHQTLGSSAGSGSGDFHVYRRNKAVEQLRLANMEEQFLRQQELIKYEQNKAAIAKQLEEQQRKRVTKRKRKKERKLEKIKLNNQGGNSKASSEAEEEQENASKSQKSEEEKINPILSEIPADGSFMELFLKKQAEIQQQSAAKNCGSSNSKDNSNSQQDINNDNIAKQPNNIQIIED
jgi:hypothetical protein